MPNRAARVRGSVPSALPDRQQLLLPGARFACALPELDQRIGKAPLGRDPKAYRALASEFLQRFAIGDDRLLKARDAVFSVRERAECISKSVLGGRPFEGHTL